MWCGGHPGLEREADAKIPLDAEEFPLIAVLLLVDKYFPNFPFSNIFNQKFLKMGVLSYPWARQDQKVVKKSGGGCFQKLEAK